MKVKLFESKRLDYKKNQTRTTIISNCANIVLHSSVQMGTCCELVKE